jgi:beta-glucanase (GH16 family)
VFEKTGDKEAVFNENEGLLFFDDFSGGKLDTAKWAIPSNQLRHGRSAWDKSMVSVRDGNLIIGLKRDPAAGEKYNIKNDKNFILTGAVETKGLFENAYGYYETNIKFPVVRGTWGAFWMYGDSVGGTDYEGVDGTEIDIIESIGNDKGESSSNLHWNGYGDAHKAVGSGNYTKKDYASPTGIYDGEFHMFAIDWSPTEYIFYIDGKEMWRVDSGIKFDNVGICRNPLHVILSVEGAEWATALPKDFEYDEMVVDYVKVYDRPRY